jgi:ribonucleoside-diphosphate reductase alpha chain
MPTAYASVIDALSANDLTAARDILLAEIDAKTAGKGSWDCPHYIADRSIQESINLEAVPAADLPYFGLENLRDRYFLRDAQGEICENPRTFYARVATGMARGDRDLAQRLYDYLRRHWIVPSSPTLMNIGTKRGLPISCFLNTIPDTLEGIFDAYRENAFMAKYGGGIGTDFSQLRGLNAPLQKSGLRSSGVIPFLKVMDSVTIAVSRNGIRRGAAAAYLRVDHPDVEEFLEMRKASGGDMDRKCLNINNGLVITDEFMEAVEAGGMYKLRDPHYGTITKELDAVEMWRRILKMRAETGEPYMLFIDTVNKAVPEHHREKGLFVRQSNLCTEIVLHTTDDRTAVCCLMNMNLEKYDEWKHLVSRIADDCVTALDNNLESFCDLADPVEFKKAINSVKHERSIGLGTMGYHGYLMSKNVPFESLQARLINKEIYKQIHESAVAASIRLGQERGLPLDGGTRRNSYITSVQPTASTAFLCGGATPAVEPMAGNAFLQKTLSGSFLVKNKHLERLLATKNADTTEVWKTIIAAKGSVQHLDILSDDEKKVFRTAYEMNMREIVQQAADRQPYIEQAQSLNLFFETPISGKYLDETHRMAWKLGVKSLYYVRSSAPIQADSIDIKVAKRDVAAEECAVCQ